jgi:hypothetical protein
MSCLIDKGISDLANYLRARCLSALCAQHYSCSCACAAYAGFINLHGAGEVVAVSCRRGAEPVKQEPGSFLINPKLPVQAHG